MIEVDWEKHKITIKLPRLFYHAIVPLLWIDPDAYFDSIFSMENIPIMASQLYDVNYNVEGGYFIVEARFREDREIAETLLQVPF